MVSLKNFLDPILAQEDDASNRTSILLEYLDAVKPCHYDDDDNAEAVYLNSIMLMWQAASSSNYENVMSAAAVALDLLIRVLSSMINMKDYGLGICRTLLQRDRLLLIARNLSVEKGKEFVISPTLRLVREIVEFDGGNFADDVFRSRSYTLKALERNMRLKYLGEGLESEKRASGRTNAMYLFLSILKYINTDGRQELLSLKDVVTGLFQNIKDDPPKLVHELLHGLKAHVLEDKKLKSQAKLKVFNAYTLPRLLLLYNYSHDADKEPDRRVSSIVHKLLIQLCSSTDGGILRPNAGFYPPGVDPDNKESVSWQHSFEDEIPVRHGVLLDLSKNLKPWSRLKHNELMLAILQSAPELVAPYCRSLEFSFDPKLTSTWIGYAAFLFNIVELPIPRFFGHPRARCAKLPPPTCIVIDNILPAPLTKEALTKCLAQQSPLLSFFAVRLLIVAFQKLERICILYRITGWQEWEEEILRLRLRFATRVPTIRDVLKAYISTSEQNLLHREAGSRLLYLYLRLVTETIQTTSLDISRPLLDVIQRLEAGLESLEDEALLRMELDNLISLTSISLGIKWFSKAGGLNISLFTSLLRLSIKSSTAALPERLLTSLHHAAQSHSLVNTRGAGPTAFTCLFHALQHIGSPVPEYISAYVDNCVTRCANAEMKYLLMSMELGEQELGTLVDDPISPLTMVLCEQLSFAVQSSSFSEESLLSISKFLTVYLSLCRQVENTSQLNILQEKIMSAMPENTKSKRPIKLENCLSMNLDPIVDTPQLSSSTSDSEAFAREGWVTGVSQPGSARDNDELAIASLVNPEPLTQPDFSSLTRWVNKPVESLVHDGHISALIHLLASQHPGHRAEASSHLIKLATRVKNTSSYPPSTQIWLLLMELVETVSPSLSQYPVPGIFLSFASSALPILTKPLHPLYAALNHFLLRGPAWHTSKLLLVDTILDAEDVENTFSVSFGSSGSNSSSSFYISLLFLLEYLASGIRSVEDVSLLVKNRRAVERLLSLSCVHAKTRERIRFAALELISRVAEVEGGADALRTRFGIVDWLKGLEEMTKEENAEKQEGKETRAYRLVREKVMNRLSGTVKRAWSRSVITT